MMVAKEDSRNRSAIDFMIQKVSALQVFTKSVDQELRGRILGFRAEERYRGASDVNRELYQSE